jgi:diguanylate cyclase (GGDEF)-like protein
MFDIDKFKTLNDSYGHDSVDVLLAAIGRKLRETLRGGDIACRYGGDEFLVVLAESSPEDATRRCEQIRDELKRVRVSHRGQMLPGVTLSIGVAVFPTHGTIAAALIEAADKALYRSKQDGRDRVSVAA